MKSLTTRKKGFTLSELLVVIAIIAILASILFPVLITSKQAAQKTQCCNNIKQLSQALNLYRSDWNGWYPLGGFKYATGDYSLEWQNVIWKYGKKDALFRCPATICPDMDPTDPTGSGNNALRPRTPVTYLYNMGLGADMSSAALYQNQPKSHHESEVTKSTKCIAILEGNPGVVASTFSGTDCHGRQKTLWLRDYTFYKNASVITGGDTAKKSFGLPHHRDGGNVLFADGHTSYFKYQNSKSLQASLPWLVHVPLCSSTCGLRIEDEPWNK